MARRFVRRWLPDPASLRARRGLRWMGPLLDRPWLWHVNRNAIAKGLAKIGAMGGPLLLGVARGPAFDEAFRRAGTGLAHPAAVAFASMPGTTGGR